MNTNQQTPNIDKLIERAKAWHNDPPPPKQLTCERDAREYASVVAQRDELLAAAKEARMALTLDYHGATKKNKALCDVSAAASQAHNALTLAIQRCNVTNATSEREATL
jgi:hypothetical protein